MATNKTSIDISLPKSQKVRGYLIDRMPIGRFLKATQTLQELPENVVKQLFPQAQGTDVLKQLSVLTKDGLQALFLRALSVLPKYVVEVFSDFSGIDAEQLTNDPAVGLDGLAEMFLAWVEVNGIENFIKAAGALWEKVRKMSSGSKD